MYDLLVDLRVKLVGTLHLQVGQVPDDGGLVGLVGRQRADVVIRDALLHVRQLRRGYCRVSDAVLWVSPLGETRPHPERCAALTRAAQFATLAARPSQRRGMIARAPCWHLVRLPY